MSGSSFSAELKRRNVLRAGAFYAASAWLLVQIATQVFPFFHIAEWVVRWIVVAAVIGFPFALAFAWFYEFTPQGLKRESEVALNESITRRTGRKLDRWIIAVLALAVVLLLANTFVLHKGAGGSMARAAPAKSIAVLPFANLSGDPKNAYFSDGITEEILNALAQVRDLKVAGRTSAFQFNGQNEDLRKVGETLGVATVLEGSVQRAQDQVRITAQLVDAHSGYQLWSEKFDRKLTNIFAVEDEISNAIAEKLSVQLSTGRAEVSGNTANPQAHELYLRGLTLLAARGPGLREAIAAFRQAVELDPRYAQAWGGLAEAEQLLPGYVFVDVDTAMERAETAAQSALRIDPDMPSALVAMGNVYGYRIQWAEADSAFRHALSVAPADVEAIDQYAQFLETTGQLEAALRQIERAQRLDPLSAVIGAVRTSVLMGLHRDADAVAQIQGVLSARPGFYPACINAVVLYVHLGRYADAETQLRAMARTLGVDVDAKVLLVRGMADPAERSAALRSLEAAPANADLRADALIHATFLALLGDRDRAFDQLDTYAARRNGVASGFMWLPALDPLRGDPRFKAILKKLGLPYAPAEAAPSIS